MSFTKILDCLAWLLGAIALGMGIVFVTASVGGLSAFLIDGNSFASMVWNFSDPKILKGMAEGPPILALLGLTAIVMVTAGRDRPTRVSMAAWAVRSGKWALVFAGVLMSLVALMFACRQALFPGM
jgi:hypothetical protein